MRNAESRASAGRGLLSSYSSEVHRHPDAASLRRISGRTDARWRELWGQGFSYDRGFPSRDPSERSSFGMTTLAKPQVHDPLPPVLFKVIQRLRRDHLLQAPEAGRVVLRVRAELGVVAPQQALFL